MRDLEGRLRVLSRVCRHRAMPVVLGRGEARSFQCPYHRWTYGLDGRLLAAPVDFLVCAVFPFGLFSLQPDSMLWYQLEPTAVDGFRLRIHPCVPEAALADAAYAEALDGFRAFADLIHRQDITACRGVQAGLRSRLAEPGHYSHLEKALWQLQRFLLERAAEA